MPQRREWTSVHREKGIQLLRSAKFVANQFIENFQLIDVDGYPERQAPKDM